MKNRRDFLKEVCPTVAFAFFGISFLEACSADSIEDDANVGTTPQNNNNGGNSNNGGMIIWKKTPDETASFKDFNSLESMDKIKNEVKDTDFMNIPYKSNRAVIFNSKLYHATDKIEFKDNYKDRRVNVTFLYK